VKLFQIEEPDGGPPNLDAPGAAIGIDASGAEIEIAMSVGGNAVLLTDRAGFEQSLTVPHFDNGLAEWQTLFEGARLRAERALARPVTHAVIVLARTTPNATTAAKLTEAAEQAGLRVLSLPAVTDLVAGTVPAKAAAMLAEDLAPRPEEGPL
jgi:hypothetical protein